ncbi:hypothetical protein [Streptomyces sp. NPDC091209]|uniref:hypothetical protein n=1 Tax=Streptomyces sp. NPDC091209 TaxID=3365974 RepID=UPI00381A577D
MVQKNTLGLSALKDTIVRASSAGTNAARNNDLNTTRNHTTRTTPAGRTTTTAHAITGRAASPRDAQEGPDAAPATSVRATDGVGTGLRAHVRDDLPSRTGRQAIASDLTTPVTPHGPVPRTKTELTSEGGLSGITTVLRRPTPAVPSTADSMRAGDRSTTTATALAAPTGITGGGAVGSSGADADKGSTGSDRPATGRERVGSIARSASDVRTTPPSTGSGTTPSAVTGRRAASAESSAHRGAQAVANSVSAGSPRVAGSDAESARDAHPITALSANPARTDPRSHSLGDPGSPAETVDGPRPLAVELDLLKARPGSDEIARIDALAAEVAHEAVERDRTGRPLPDVTYTVHRPTAVAGQPHFGRSLRTSTVWVERIRAVFEQSIDARLPDLAARLRSRVVLEPADADGGGRSATKGVWGTDRAVIAVRDTAVPKEFLEWVNRHLGQLGGTDVPEERVRAAVQALEHTRAAAFTRMDMKARAEATARRIKGVEFAGMRGGARPDRTDAESSSTGRHGLVGASQEGPSSSGGAVGPPPLRAAATAPRLVSIGADLDQRRPPRIDRELPPPPDATGPVLFDDGSRLPTYMTGEMTSRKEPGAGRHETTRQVVPGTGRPRTIRPFVLGAGRHEVRGAELVVGEVGGWLERNAAVRPEPGKGFEAHQEPPLLRQLLHALGGDPREFVGVVKSFPFKTVRGQARELRMNTVPYGEPERWLDNPTKIDTAQRLIQGGGRTRVNGTSWGLGLSTALGPASGVVAGWFHGYIKFAWGKSARHTLQHQVMNHTETRSTDGSHVHLDALGYAFWITDGSGRQVGLNGGPVVGDGPHREATELRFAVRDGLSLRLADSLTATASETGSTFPQTIDLTNRPARLHEVSVEDVVLLEPVADAALTMMGLEAGAKGAEQVTELVSPAALRRSMRALLMGPVTSPVLYGGAHGTDPLGMLRMEVVPQRLVRIGDMTTAAEIRDIAQSVVRSERASGVTRSVELGAAVGPGFHASVPGGAKLRIQAGPHGRYGASVSRTTALGNAAGIKVGAQKKGAPTALYLLEQNLVMTGPAQVHGRAGAPPDRGASGQRTLRKNQPQRQPRESSQVWALVRLSEGEARRLDEPVPAPGPVEQGPTPIPLLVTERSLGVSRVHEVSFPEGGSEQGDRGRVRPAEFFAESVLSRLGGAYPGMVASLPELYPGNPRWSSTDHFLTVLHNTREVYDRLSHQSMASNLGSMLDTGLRIGLTQWTPLGRRHVDVWVRARLHDREYLGRRTEQRGRFSAPGSDSLSGQRGSSRSWQVGVEGAVALRDGAAGTAGMPLHVETAAVGVRYGRRTQSESGYALSGGDEVTSITTGGADWYRYGVRFTVESGGHWRPRHWMRGVPSGYLLGTQAFVSADRTRALIGPGAAGGDHAAERGEVVLSVPVEYTGTVGLERVVQHRGEVMTAADARAMALGTRSWLDEAAARDTNSVAGGPRSVLSYPYTTIDVTEGPQLLDMARTVLNRATGGSWQFRLRGADGSKEAELPVLLESRIANFGTTSAPVGGHWTLLTAAPYLDRTTMFAYRTRLIEAATADLRGLTALTLPMKMEVEAAANASVGTWGRETTISTGEFGGRINQLTSLTDARVASSVGLQLGVRIGNTTSAFVQRNATWAMNRKDVGGYQVVVSAPVEHAYAAASSRLGKGAHGVLVPPSLSDAHGEKRLSRWVGVIPGKAAYELEAVRDGYGAVLRYDELGWTEFPWLRQAQFGGWPADSLNPAAALSRLEEVLRPLGLPDNDFEHLRRLVSGRVIRALSNEMAGQGVVIPARLGRWGSETLRTWIRSREVQLRVQLIPTANRRFHGLDHGVELEEQLQATETVQHSRSRSTRLAVGLTVAERADTGNPTVSSAGPAYSQTASATWATGETQSDSTGFGTIVTYADHLHAAVAQEYDVQIDVRISGDGETAEATLLPVRRPAGVLHKHLPLSLMWSGPDPARDDDPLAPTDLVLPGRTRRVALPAMRGARGWRDVAHAAGGGAQPFAMPAEGFAVRGFVGLEELHSANILALGAAYDSTIRLPRNVEIDDDGLLARAQDTPLTKIGTGARENLEAGTSALALTAFFAQTLTADGYQVAGLEWRGFFGGVSGRLDLHSRPDFSGARLLTVADGVKFESPRQSARGSVSTFAHAGTSEHGVDVGPTGPTAAGSTQEGGNASAPAAESKSVGLSLDGQGSVNVKPDNKPRAYLFALPVRWLSVAHAHHDVKDGALMAAVRGAFHLARREPLAMETDTVALAWVREDVARRLGLLTDTNHPAPARQAWDAVKQASAALAASDKALWDLRLGAGAVRETALDRARVHLDELERRDVDTLPAVREARDTLVALLREHAEDDAEAAHEGWDRLRGALIEQARERLEQARRAGADELTAARAAEAEARGSVEEVAETLRALHEHGRALHRDLVRLRRAADRLTAWHQLSADEQERLRGQDTPEPDAVTFTPPKAPVLPSTATKASKPAPPKTAAPASRKDDPSVDPRRAHATAPWQPRHGAMIAEDGPSFDVSGDHRTLTMTDADGGLRVHDLHPPRADAHGALLRPGPDGSLAANGRPVDGNGFWAAVGLAGERIEQPMDLALRAAGADLLGQDIHLYRRAVFHVEEVERVAPEAFARDPELRQRIRGDGGHLPEEVRGALTEEQTRALTATTLVMARRWDARTAARAAALAARTGPRDLIVVEEDGSHRLYTAQSAEDTDDRPVAIVYRRGDSYLAAMERGSDRMPAGAHVSDEARRRAIREGKRPAREHGPAGGHH